MPGWEFPEYVLLAIIAPLLAASAFFSGSETALFGLSESEKFQLRRRKTIGSRAVDALLQNPRLLLITILGGNMTVNVFYFVISSVLIMHAQAGVTASILMAAAVFVLIVLFGEVLPKLAANAHRASVALACAPPLLALHRATTPIRLAVDRAIVTPLSQLTAPTAAPPRLDAEELAALLDVTRDQGVIDVDEQRLMRDVIDMGQRKVRDIMTPRVRMPAVCIDLTRDKIVSLLRRERKPLVPVYDVNLDHIIGVLDAMAMLREDIAAANAPGNAKRGVGRLSRSALLKPVFVPEITTVDRLLQHLRARRTRAAIVVDEYGGTSGFVTLADVIDEIARVEDEPTATTHAKEDGT